jgi:hypothetical protein
MRNISGKNLDKVKIHTFRSITVFSKSCRLKENVGGKNVTVRQAKDGSTYRMRRRKAAACLKES